MKESNELARATGAKVVTVRYYEKIGLLPPPSRSSTNYRSYSGRDLIRLRFIRRCRNLGFTLDQIRELLRLSSDSEHDCTEVDRFAAALFVYVELKIADLNQLSNQLRRIGARCRVGGRIADCRKEAEEMSTLLILCNPGPESESKESELHNWVGLGTIVLSAIHDLRLFRMHR